MEGDEDTLQTALSLISETGADTYTHLLLNESLYTAMLTDVTAVPTTFFVDSEGRILDTVLGSKEKDAWKELIDVYLEEEKKNTRAHPRMGRRGSDRHPVSCSRRSPRRIYSYFPESSHDLSGMHRDRVKL